VAAARREAAAVAPDPRDGQGRVHHRIRPGDTLSAIATQYGTTVRELQAWNGLLGSAIAAGDVLTIYTGALRD
jgi:LysM repeat protein